jgi:O-antigen/teichoic acid export membrane protein
VIARLTSLIATLRSSDFLRQNALFFTGSLAISVLNYAYYPILGRLMSTSDFGEVQTLVSLFLQATIFLNVVTNVTVNIVSNERNEDLRNRIVYELQRVSLFITLAALTVMVLLIPQIKTFLQFEHVGPFFVFALSLLVSVPGALRNAFLRGRSAFGQLSIAGIVGALAKIVFSVLFVLLGWRTMGAIGGLVAAQLLALAYAAWQARRLGLQAPAATALWRQPDLSIIKPHLRYALLVLIVSLVTTMLFSFDVIVVKHYFPAETAGFYAGIATVARIIFFLTASIAAVLLSSVKLQAPAATNRRLLLRSALLQTGIGGSAFAVFALAPALVTHILIGAKYTPYAHLLPKLSLALLVLAYVSLFFNYDMALRRTSAAIIAVVGMAITASLVILHHATLDQVVDSLLLGSLIILAIRALDSLRRRTLTTAAA